MFRDPLILCTGAYISIFVKPQSTTPVCHILYEYCGCTENSVTEKQFFFIEECFIIFLRDKLVY